MCRITVIKSTAAYTEVGKDTFNPQRKLWISNSFEYTCHNRRQKSRPPPDNKIHAVHTSQRRSCMAGQNHPVNIIFFAAHQNFNRPICRIMNPAGNAADFLCRFNCPPAKTDSLHPAFDFQIDFLFHHSAKNFSTSISSCRMTSRL